MFELRKVLVVDATPEDRLVTRALVEGLGYETVCASSAPEALERLREGGFFAVISDVAMPEKGGLVLLQEVRDRLSLRRLVFILVSSSPLSDEGAFLAYVYRAGFLSRGDELGEGLKQLLV